MSGVIIVSPCGASTVYSAVLPWSPLCHRYFHCDWEGWPRSPNWLFFFLSNWEIKTLYLPLVLQLLKLAWYAFSGVLLKLCSSSTRSLEFNLFFKHVLTRESYSTEGVDCIGISRPTQFCWKIRLPEVWCDEYQKGGNVVESCWCLHPLPGKTVYIPMMEIISGSLGKWHPEQCYEHRRISPNLIWIQNDVLDSCGTNGILCKSFCFLYVKGIALNLIHIGCNNAIYETGAVVFFLKDEHC